MVVLPRILFDRRHGKTPRTRESSGGSANCSVARRHTGIQLGIVRHRSMSVFREHSGHCAESAECPLLTQSGHDTARWTVSPLGRDADLL